MTHYLDQLIALVSAHAWMAYLTIFLAAVLEAVPVFGSLVPGSTIILALGALIPGGELALAPVLACAILGALLGDGAAYLAGRRGQRTILSAWPLSRYPGVVAQSETFFAKWGTWAVFFARFLAPVRAFVPITAGALEMPPQRFFPVNAAAIVFWSLAHVLPGVFAATLLARYGGLKGFEGELKHYWMPLVVAGALLAGLALWFLRRRKGINVPVKRVKQPKAVAASER